VAIPRYARHYLSLLAGLEGDILGGDGAPAALDTITREFANIREAWRWGLDEREGELVRAGSWTLVQYGELTGYYQPAAELLTQAVEELDPARPSERRAWASSLGARAFLSFRMNDFPGAIADGERAYEVLGEFLEPTGNWGRWISVEGAGAAAIFTGDLDAAESFVRRALQSAVDDRAVAWSPLDIKRADVTAGISQMVLGFVETQRGAFAEAAERLRESSELLRPHRSPYLSYALWNLGQILVGMGRLEESLASLREAHVFARAMGFRALVGLIAVDLAKTHVELGEVERAHEWCGAALAEASALGDTWMPLSALSVVGRLHSARSEYERALTCFGESFRAAFDIGAFTFGMEALIGAADALARTGHALQAAEALGFVSDHPSTPGPGRRQAAHELTQLMTLHGQPAMGTAAERGGRLAAAEIAERVVGPVRDTAR
jgi:tetratricopeptide (TPR) repeat protein